MQKTVYICDRCGKESEDLQGWNSLRYEGDDEGWVPTLLCPTCSSRALEKPEVGGGTLTALTESCIWGLRLRPGSLIEIDSSGYATGIRKASRR